SLIPMFAMSFIFIVFVNPQFGIVNQFLGLFGMPDTNLLGEPRYAKIVIILMAQLAAGNAALIYLAGLRNIPPHPLRGGAHRRCREDEAVHRDHAAAADPHDPVQPDHGRLRRDDGVHRGVHHDRRRTGQRDAVLHAVPLPERLLLRAAGLRLGARGAAVPVRDAPGRPHLLALAPVRQLRRGRGLRGSDIMAITQMNSPGRTAEPTRPLKSRSDYGRNPDGSRPTGISAWISRLVILAVLLLFSLPLYWMIISALKGPEELAMVPPTLFPQEFHWSNFREATTVMPFWLFFRNSALITLSVVVFSV